MTTIPSLDSENEIPLRHEFIITGFVERIASWARFLSLCFLFLQLVTIAVNLVFPFAIDPPLFFNQLLFFMLACAAFEIFAIPIEAIKDHCVIDLQKSMIIKIYHRYFYTRVEVVAPFDKIRAIGVSSRPAPIWRKFFSDSPLRYAILMLSDESKVSRLTDYNLGLDAANKLIKSLHESYLRDVNVIYGSRNIELVIDQKMSDTFVTRHCERSTLSLVDAAILPAFQAISGAVLVTIMIAITAMTGDFLSDQFFNTRLKIANQPIFQVLLASGTPDQEHSPLTPPEGPPPAEPTQNYAVILPLKDEPLPESKTMIASAQTAPLATIPATDTTQFQLETPAVTVETAEPQMVSGPVATEPVLTAMLESPPAPILENIAGIAAPSDKTDAKEEVDTGRKPLTVEVTARIVPAKIVFVPLPSRIPSFDEKIITESEKEIQATPVIAPAKAVETAPISPAEAIKTLTRPVTEKVSVASYLDQSVEYILKTLGKPLASIKSSNGQQLIYSGITLQTDPSCHAIQQINLTSRKSRTLGILATEEGLSVGSRVREASSRLGIPHERPGTPGLHFPEHGISIYPLPGDPGIIGSIKLYRSDSN
ncbi:MAG: hypothetical protein CVV42_12020 [Candidatus Riflebacteria bacterium HGW-Riflebacteria-2]|jgi:hypothetical protein|nr:MAG: hypothetical protein CVV42_12020 [Candidatus Riflebacteria bacterium HGW-Riflebacteria-2]